MVANPRHVAEGHVGQLFPRASHCPYLSTMIEPGDQRSTGEAGLTSSEEEEVEDHLRGLGYFE